MFSLPPVAPRDYGTTWYTTTSLNPSLDDTHGDASRQASQSHPHPASQHLNSSTTLSPLAQLAQDENSIAQRSATVRRFGATWIRPPGISKTFQAMIDEAAEREEQEQILRREQAVAELTNATQAAERDHAAQALEARVREAEERAVADRNARIAEEAGDGLVDLDAEIREASEDEGAFGDEDEDPFAESDEGEGSMAGFDAERMGSDFDPAAVVAGEEDGGDGVLGMRDVEEVADLLRSEGDMFDDDLDDDDNPHDLDDDLPEAGEYEHTDTELDLESSELVGSGGDEAMAAHPIHRLTSAATGARAPPRRSSALLAALESSTIDSSFVQSSPAARRGRRGR